MSCVIRVPSALENTPGGSLHMDYSSDNRSLIANVAGKRDTRGEYGVYECVGGEWISESSR